MIKEFIKTQPYASFINVFPLMLNAAGEPLPEIFIADSLHMNAKVMPFGKKPLLHI